MNFDKTQAAFLVLVAFSVVMWALFLNYSGVSLERLFEFQNAGENLGRMTSTEFLMFIAFFPLTPALAVVACNSMGKTKAMVTVLGGVAGGLIASALLFPALLSFWLAAVFYLGSFLLVIEVFYIRKAELKKFSSFRLLNEGAKNIVMVTGIGVFFLSVMVLLPNQGYYVRGMEDQLIEMVGRQAGSDSELLEVSIDNTIQIQQQTLKQLLQSQQFLELKGVGDSRAQNFVLMAEQLSAYLNSVEYRQAVKEQVEARQAGLLQEENIEEILEKMKGRIPLWGLLTDYFWLAGAFVAFSVFMLIGNIFFRALAIVYGLALGLALKPLAEPEG